LANTARDIDQRFWSSKAIPHLTIRSTYNSVQGYKAHSHPELSIGIIESGKTQTSVDGQHIVLGEGDIVLIEPNLVHACNPVEGKPRSYHMLYVDNTWCCNLLTRLYGYQVTQFICGQRLVSEAECGLSLSALIGLLSDQESREQAAELDNLLFSLISRYCSPVHKQNSDDELANKVRNRLLEDIVHPPSLETLSQELGRPKETLIRNFKNQFGIPPKSFLNNNRIEKAKYLLRYGMNIVDASTEVGFSDQSQFHRNFVSYTASTPRQYQQLTSFFDNNS